MRVSLAEEEPIMPPKGLLKGQSSVPLGRTAGGFRLGSEQLGVGHLAPATRPREVEANVPGSCSGRRHLCPEKCHREVRPQPVRRGFGVIRCLLAELLRGGPGRPQSRAAEWGTRRAQSRAAAAVPVARCHWMFSTPGPGQR